MAITPMEPLGPPQAPPLPPPQPPCRRTNGSRSRSFRRRSSRQPITGWQWDSSSAGDSPPLTTESLLRDTLPDLPAGLEGTSDSEVSMSLIVDPPRRMPIELLVVMVLAPVVLAGIGLVLAWIFNFTPY